MLDTNAVLDCWLFEDARALPLRQALAGGQLRWHATAAMVAELADVLTRPLGARWDAGRERLRHGGLEGRIELASAAPTAPQPPRELICRDPDDQKFLDLALHLRVRWLVTRDRALLDLRRPAAERGLAIVEPGRWSAG